jgi:hypothetical protein
MTARRDGSAGTARDRSVAGGSPARNPRVACRCPPLPTVKCMSTQRSAADVADLDLLDRFDIDDELDIDLFVELHGLVGLIGVAGVAGAARRRRGQ